MSLQNQLMGRATINAPEPVPGMGVTELCYTDRHPYTVMRVLSPNKCTVTRDDYRVVAGSTQDGSAVYEYATNTTYGEVVLRRNKRNQWKREGDSQGNTYAMGYRVEYRDPSF